MKPSGNGSELYALLIGVDFYFPGGGCGHLGGCVRDVTHVEAYLQDRLLLPADHILKLTATNTGAGQPAEPPERWPTYANLVAAFQQLTAQAQPGDRVYIHYAGHGGRAKTIYPELKADGLDEGLIPTDIGQLQGRYLRDVEMNYLLQAMVDKGLIVTIVLDSCHSGGATRAANGLLLGAQPRGIAEVDQRDLPTESLVAPRETLVAAWQARSTQQTRAAKSVSGWLLEPKGYTLLAACRANELAFEYPFNGRENNGALTYWLLDTLRQAGPQFTYKMLHDRVLAKVHGQFDKQTPMLQGEGDVVVFGAERIRSVYAVPVLAVEASGRVQLNAGEAHGLARGAQLALYPHTADIGNLARRIAQVEVTDLEAVHTWAQPVEPPTAPIEVGAQAVFESSPISFQRHVALDVRDPALRAAFEAALAAHGKGFARLAGAGEPVHFVVALRPDGELRIENAADQPVSNLRPAIYAHEPEAVERVVARLVHLARYQSVHELRVLDPGAAQKLKVELDRKSVV